MPHRPVPQYSSAQQVYQQFSRAVPPLAAMCASQVTYGTGCSSAARTPCISLCAEIHMMKPNQLAV